MMPTFANAGLPMLALYWPGLIVSLLPIILIEAAVYRASCGGRFKHWAADVTIANFASTMAGIPVTWCVLFIGQLVLLSFSDLALDLDASVGDTAGGRLAIGIVTAPWPFPPMFDDPWLVPASGIILTLPFMLVSIVIEHAVIRKRVTRRHPDTPPLSRWIAWRANGLTYAIIVVLCIPPLYMSVT